MPSPNSEPEAPDTPPEPPAPEPEDEDSLGDEDEAVLGASEDPDLDNPEFLYESNSDDESEELFGSGINDEFNPEAEGDALGVPASHAEGEEPLGAGSEPSPGDDCSFADVADDDPMGSWDPFDETSPPEQGSPASEGPPEEAPQGLAGAPVAAESIESWEEGVDSASPDLAESRAFGSKRTSAAPGAGQASGTVLAHAPGSGVILRSLAFCVALALVFAGLRALGPHALLPAPGPEVVQHDGWVASGIDASILRDNVGRSFLIVQGELSSTGGSRLPEVQVTLLDERRQVLGAAVTGRVDRPDPIRATSAFRVLIAEPPPEARRFRIDLLPGPPG